jgi:hypothetical protein
LCGVELGPGYIQTNIRHPPIITRNLTVLIGGVPYIRLDESRSKLHTTQKDTPPGYHAINIGLSKNLSIDGGKFPAPPEHLIYSAYLQYMHPRLGFSFRRLFPSISQSLMLQAMASRSRQRSMHGCKWERERRATYGPLTFGSSRSWP